MYHVLFHISFCFFEESNFFTNRISLPRGFSVSFIMKKNLVCHLEPKSDLPLSTFNSSIFYSFSEKLQSPTSLNIWKFWSCMWQTTLYRSAASTNDQERWQFETCVCLEEWRKIYGFFVITQKAARSSRQPGAMRLNCFVLCCAKSWRLSKITDPKTCWNIR